MATPPDTLAMARDHHHAGRFQAAEELYRQILAAQPNHIEANYELGDLLKKQGKYIQALACFQRALQLKPDFAEAYNKLGVTQAMLGMVAQAIDSFQQTLKLKPEFAEGHNHLGNVLKRQGRIEEAIACYNQALQLQPDYADAYYNMGNTLKDNGQVAEATACYERALEIKPNYVEALSNLGVALLAQRQTARAAACFRRTLELMPQLAWLHSNLGGALREMGQLDEAIECYRRALQLKPNYAEAHTALGLALYDQGQAAEAMDGYRRAILFNPLYAEAHAALGYAFYEQGKMSQAADSYRRALQLKPDYAEAYIALGMVLDDMGVLDEAVACSQRGLQLTPDNPKVRGDLCHQLQKMCLWQDVRSIANGLIEVFQGDRDASPASAVLPFEFMALPIPTTAQQQYQCAHTWAEQHLKLIQPDSESAASARPRRDNARLTLGYLSADFRAHPVGFMLPELIEKHDRNRFAVYGYSHGQNDGSNARQRLVQAFDRFVDVTDESFMAAARRIAADGVDILIDLRGYTGHSRPQIAAFRPAPIQINFLGYPGTMAAPFVDYILVDEFVVPADQQSFFSEKLVHLPGCYQVNDSRRDIAQRTPTRAECALPQSGFVFCCFNNSWKITPEMFDVWMQLLKAVNGSVLWLLESNRFVAANLRREALAREVSPDRLVFAPQLPLPDHLARHRLADLALDTIPYNAHTTASDALWAGLPLLTNAGHTFPSRVAGSLLRTIGLPELITISIEEYYAMALRLASDSVFLANMRSRLQANRSTSPLFDGGVFARNMEKALITMWQIHTAGQPPRAFVVDASAIPTAQ